MLIALASVVFLVQEEVGLAPRWQVGDSYLYEVVQTRLETAGGRALPEVESRWKIEVEVTATGEQTLGLRWVLRDFEVVRPEGASQLLTRTASFSEGIELELETDSFGVPERIANLEEVQRGFLAIRAVLDEPLARDAAAEERAQIEQAAAAWLDPALVQAGALVEPLKFFMPMGLSIEPGEPQRYQEDLPNPLGSDPLLAQCSFELVSHDPETGRAEVAWERTLDRASTERAIRAELARLAAADGRPAPDPAQLPRFENSSSASWTMDTRRGWPLAMTWSTRVETDDFSREDRWQYTLR